MLKKVNLKSTLVWASIGAIVFSVPVYLFIRSHAYSASWLLYMGSFLFLIAMWLHTTSESKHRGENESTLVLVFFSHITTIVGIFLSCLICFILLMIMVPGYFDGGTAGRALIGEPANTVQGNTDGLSFKIFMTATVINFSVGSFAGILLPFYANRNQTPDSKTPSPLHQYGKR